MSSSPSDLFTRSRAVVPSPTVPSSYGHVKANRIVKENVAELIRHSGLTRKDVAQWCHKTESWISKIFKEDRREFANSDLDRIADLFHVDVYRLYQPGVARTTERRKGYDRRTKQERRVPPTERFVVGLASAVDPYRIPTGSSPSASEARHHGRTAAAIEADIARLTDEFNRAVTRLLQEADPRRQAAPARPHVPKASARGRTAGRSDADLD